MGSFFFPDLRAMTKRILMVCMGNICRSPMAEGILRAMAEEKGLHLHIDSAGTIGNHVGEAPDPRAQACMIGHGIDISGLRARQVKPEDARDFDLLLAMDEENLEDIRRMTTDPLLLGRMRLMMDHAPEHPLREVPDPWYGGPEGFETVYDMLTEACGNLVNELTHG